MQMPIEALLAGAEDYKVGNENNPGVCSQRGAYQNSGACRSTLHSQNFCPKFCKLANELQSCILGNVGTRFWQGIKYSLLHGFWFCLKNCLLWGYRSAMLNWWSKDYLSSLILHCYTVGYFYQLCTSDLRNTVIHSVYARWAMMSEGITFRWNLDDLQYNDH